MKKFLYLCILLMVVACQHHYQYPPALQQADSLCVANPDSAVSLLKAIAGEMQQAPAYVQKRYHLLTIKANDKAYITHTSDSLILSLVNYYENDGDPAYLGESYYYAGSTYRDLGDAPRALEYYQKALDAMPGNENLKVKSKVYAQMGNLYTKQKLYRQAIESFQQSYQCDIIRKDTLGMIYNLRDIGFALRGVDKPDSTIILLKKAHELALLINNQVMDDRITSQMASLYIRLGEYEKAKKFIQPSLIRPNRNNLSSVFTIAGDIYYKLGQIDSAAYYYQSLMNVGTIYAKRDAYYNLSHIAQNNWKDINKSLYYIDQYKHLQDSISRITATESIAQMNALYNYNLREKENNRLLIKQKDYQNYLIIGILFLFIMVTGISVHIMRNKHRRQLILSELQKEQAKNYYFEDYIAQREAVIKQMEKEEGAKDSENLELKAEITRQRQLLDDYTRSAKQTQNLASLIPGDVKVSPVYSMLQNHILDCRNLKDNEIILITDMMKTYYPVFINQLMLLSKLSLQELLICMLTKLNISNKDIASLTAKSESTISATRIRIYGKIMKTKGTAKDFNDLIHSL